MYQGEGEADGNPGKAGGRPLRCSADDDKEEKERHHHFVDKAAPEAVFAGAELAKTVSGKPAGGPPRLARSDQPQDRSSDDRADDLRDDVRDDVLVGTASGAPQTEGHRRIEVPTGYMTDG